MSLLILILVICVFFSLIKRTRGIDYQFPFIFLMKLKTKPTFVSDNSSKIALMLTCPF